MALYQLTRNVFVQDANDNADGLAPVTLSKISCSPSGNVAHISHVVNWYKGDQEAASIQDATAKSIMVAARSPNIEPIKSIACIAEDEVVTVPHGFVSSRPLTRTVLDVGTFGVPRRLSLLFDILERGAECAYPDGFLIFTNTDICLQPNFYNAVKAMLSHGFDCLVINRRTVSSLARYEGFEEFGMMESGTRHPGFDCFVFPVAWVGDFVRSHACVGAAAVMRSLLYNLVARAQAMLIMRDAHLTYHFGDNKILRNDKLKDYTVFNLNQAGSVLTALCNKPEYRNTLAEFCRAHNEPFQVSPPETLRVLAVTQRGR